mgnify:CR=1 FL=1
MKAFAKWISILIILGVYALLWGWCIDHIKDINSNTKFISRLFVFINIVALIAFCIWGWI